MSVEEQAVLARGSSDAVAPAVLVVVTSMHGGGAEWVGRVWMEQLVARGHRVGVAITSAKDTDAHLPAGVSVHRLGGLSGHVKKVRGLSALLREGGWDVAIALQAYPNLVLQAAAATVRRAERPAVVVSEHNLVTLGLPGSGIAHRAKYVVARRSYRTADHVIAVSHPVAGELVGGFGVPEGRCTVVQNPAAGKVAGHSIGVRQRLADIDVELVIAHRLVPQKRPQIAVRTAAALAARGLRVRLTMFGVGPLQDELVALARDLGVDLDVRGWAEEWFGLVSEQAVFLLASHREGFGNVLVEAAASCIPAVALSGALGVADAVVPGVTGELAVSDGPDEIADAVVRASRIRISGIEGWLEHFSPDAAGDALEHVIGAALRHRDRS